MASVSLPGDCLQPDYRLPTTDYRPFRPQITPKYGAISFATHRIDCQCHHCRFCCRCCCFQFDAFRFIYHLSVEIEIAFASRRQSSFFPTPIPIPIRASVSFCSRPGNHCQQLMNGHWWACRSFNEETPEEAGRPSSIFFWCWCWS